MDRTHTLGAAGRDRAVGALVGLAVGDALGATLELSQPGTFVPIDDMVGGGPHNLGPGEWTDDTSMAMCLAESILDTGDMDPSDQLRRYVAWRDRGYWSSRDHCFDIDEVTSRALSRFEDGPTVDEHIDQDEATNGSLARLAPVPIRWHTDLGAAIDMSGRSSSTTHPADRPVDACRFYGAMLAALIGGTAAEDVIDPDFWRFGALHPAIETVARGSWIGRNPPEIRGTGYVVDTLEAALWAVDGASSFRDAVLRAANLGDDADTTAAITGQLAGARWGVSSIPVEWQRVLHERTRIAGIGRLLYDAATDAPPPDEWAHDDVQHGYWVEPGRVLTGEYPARRDDATTTARRLNLLVDHGVRTIIDLTHPTDRLEPYVEVLERISVDRHLELFHVPMAIPAMGVVEDRRYDEILMNIREATDRGAVYVHCRSGVGRAATVAACLLVDQGLSGPEALERLEILRSSTRKAHLRAPRTEEQRNAVLRRGTGA